MRPRKPSPITAAIIYLRVSTAGQAESGLGREAQEAACRELCARHGWPVLGVHVDDGISGTVGLAGRPGLAAAVGAVHARPGTACVVYSISRLARSQRALWDLVDDRGEYALPLVSASEPFDVSTPAGRAMLGMLATFAALEADLASERTSAALGAARARGTKLGAPGMIERVVDGVRVVDEVKAAHVRRAQGLRAEGLSLREVAERLNAEGVPAAKGGRWHVRTVRVALGLDVGTVGGSPEAAAGA